MGIFHKVEVDPRRVGIIFTLWSRGSEECAGKHFCNHVSYACAHCRSVGDMSVYFMMLDSLLASEQLPSEYTGRMQQVREVDAHWLVCLALRKA